MNRAPHPEGRPGKCKPQAGIEMSLDAARVRYIARLRLGELANSYLKGPRSAEFTPSGEEAVLFTRYGAGADLHPAMHPLHTDPRDLPWHRSWSNRLLQ